MHNSHLEKNFKKQTKNLDIENWKSSSSYKPLQLVRFANEPNWGIMSKMSYFEFYLGLLERNWTSAFYLADADTWRIENFRDSGRFLRLNQWDGYRAVVSGPDGKKRWVDLEASGAKSTLSEYLGGGSQGSIQRRKHGRTHALSIEEYGFNQVIEEIFGAFEQRLSENEKNIFFDNDWWIDPRLVTYDAPGGDKLKIYYHWTIPEYTLGPYLKSAPKHIFWVFTYLIISVAIYISLRTKQNKPPTDIEGAIEFAQAKENSRKDGKVRTRFHHIAGIDNIIGEIIEIVELLNRPKHYPHQSIKAEHPKGILLVGGPGTGKTMIAKAIAGEAGVAFYQMSGAEFIQAIVGVGAARVRDLFVRARLNKPCVIFIDEIDAIGCRRAAQGVKADEEREQTLNQLLTEMDGFSPNEGLLIIAATNRADLLDPAVLRAGRFDRKILIDSFDTKSRESILRVHSQKYNISENVDISLIARDNPDSTPAELAKLLNEAGLRAVRRHSLYRETPAEIIDIDFKNARHRENFGIKRPTKLKDSINKKELAISLAGTALVASVLHMRNGLIEKSVKVTLETSGADHDSINFARFDDDEYLQITSGRIIDQMRVLCAARAAEENFNGRFTGNSSNKINTSLKLATHFVTTFGFKNFGTPCLSSEHTNRSFKHLNINSSMPPLSNELINVSNKTKARNELMAFSVLNKAYADAKLILEAHRSAFDSILIALETNGNLTENDITYYILKYPPKDDWFTHLNE